MTPPDDLRTELDELAGLPSNPFRRDEAVAQLLAHPVARRLLAGGETTTRALIAFLRQSPRPALARVAVLLLAQSADATIYDGLLDVLEGADQPLALAFDAGLWHVQRGEDAIARDILRVVETSGNPAPLILLQRPVAAAAVKPRLEAVVRSRITPFAEHAMAALAYVLGPSDIPFLAQIADEVDRPGLSAEAGVALLRLGSPAGWRGIEAGLTARDEDRRVTTFSALRPLLPEDLRRDPGFDPRRPAGSQPDAVARLRDALDGAAPD
jgi:hypothetical protein